MRALHPITFLTGKILLVLWLVAFLSICSYAQIKVTGGFLSDSIKVGEQTAFYLSAKYPSNLTVLFPDSTHDFFPFEFHEKRYFNTESENGLSTDSTIYFLTTFEIDSVLSINLPAYVINDQDCTIYDSSADSIRMVFTVKENYDSVAVDKLPLKEHTLYQPVNKQFNYVVAGIIGGVLLLLTLIGWIAFGKKIMRHFTAKRMQKRHQEFLEKFNATLSQVQTAFSRANAERALVLWKHYMEQLESKPYTKLTTRETLALSHDEVLGRNLSVLDSAIYGHEQSIGEPLTTLRSIANERFTKKLEEVRHGK